jgi:hypothetical protein
MAPIFAFSATIAEPSLTRFTIAGENIRIVHEDMSDGREDFEHAKALLKDGEQILFLDLDTIKQIWICLIFTI